MRTAYSKKTLQKQKVDNHFPTRGDIHSVMASTNWGISSSLKTECHISLKQMTVLSGDWHCFSKSMAWKGSTILSTPDWIRMKGSVNLENYPSIYSMVLSMLLMEPGTTLSLQMQGSFMQQSVWLYLLPSVNFWSTSFHVGNRVPISLPTFFMKGLACLFSLSAGDRRIAPSQAEGFLRASLKHTDPPMLNPEIQTFLLFFCWPTINCTNASAWSTKSSKDSMQPRYSPPDLPKFLKSNAQQSMEQCLAILMAMQADASPCALSPWKQKRIPLVGCLSFMQEQQ